MFHGITEKASHLTRIEMESNGFCDDFQASSLFLKRGFVNIWKWLAVDKNSASVFQKKVIFVHSTLSRNEFAAQIG